MKLQLTLLNFLALIILSCSTESTDTPEEKRDDSNVLLRKTVEKILDGETITTNYSYEQNKLVNIKTSDGYEAKFTYEDDGNLVKYEFFENGSLLSYITLTYDANKLSSSTEFFTPASGLENVASKGNFTFNNDNTISENAFSGNHNSQTFLVGTYTITMNSNNEITNDKWDSNGDTYSYEYDNKKSVYKNIENIDVIILTISRAEFSWEIFGSRNNVTKITDFQPGWPTSEEKFVYTYNENGYPISSKLYYDDDISDSETEELDSTIEYFYE